MFQFRFHGRIPLPTPPDGEIDPAVAESPGLVDNQLSALREKPNWSHRCFLFGEQFKVINDPSFKQLFYNVWTSANKEF